MTKADRISHLCSAIKGVVANANSTLFDGDWGYATRLSDVTEESGFASKDTMEVHDLDRAIEDLKAMASWVEALRNKLVKNYERRPVAAHNQVIND